MRASTDLLRSLRDARRASDHNGPTVFTPTTHKLLNALSQASYIHVREGRGAVNFSRFNRAYDA